jgi:hypothetical protein
MLAEDAIESGAIRGASDDQFGGRRNGFFMAVSQIVEDDDFVAFFQELGGDYASDVSGSSGD